MKQIMMFGLGVLLIGYCFESCFRSGGNHATPEVQTSTKSTAADPYRLTQSTLEKAKMYLESPFGRPDEVLLAKDLLGFIGKEDKDYPEAQRLLAKLPSDAALKRASDLRIKKANAAHERKMAQQRRERDGWDDDRVKAALADPAAKERMAENVRAMHDAIKEKYGAEAALRFLQRNH